MPSLVHLFWAFDRVSCQNGCIPFLWGSIVATGCHGLLSYSSKQFGGFSGGGSDQEGETCLGEEFCRNLK